MENMDFTCNTSMLFINLSVPLHIQKEKIREIKQINVTEH